MSGTLSLHTGFDELGVGWLLKPFKDQDMELQKLYEALEEEL